MRIALAPALIALAACTGAASDGASANAAMAAQARPSNGKPFVATQIGTFNEPCAMTFLPGSQNALITEKSGRLLLRTADGRTAAVSGVPAVSYAGQGGLGDVVAHPEFSRNRMVYLSFVEAGKGGLKGAAVGRGRLVTAAGAAPRLEGFQIIWRQAPKVTGNGHSATASPSAPTA